VYDINRFLDLRQFTKEINSGDLTNLNLKSAEDLSDAEWKAWKEDEYSRMIYKASEYLSSFEIANKFKIKLETRLKGEYESVGNFDEIKYNGQFTPVLRLWANNGKRTGLLKYKFFIDDMMIFFYRKMKKIGTTEELFSKYKIPMDNRNYRLLCKCLKQDNSIDRKSKIIVEDGIVCEYLIDFYCAIGNKKLFNKWIYNQAVGLVEQLTHNSILKRTTVFSPNARSYDVFGDADFGLLSTAKVVDAYTSRETTIRFIYGDMSYEQLLSDFNTGNFEIFLVHYTDLKTRNSGFRQHIDTVYDEDLKRVSGYKGKAEAFDVAYRFNHFTVGVREMCKRTQNMTPIIHGVAATMMNWNYLNDNVFTMREYGVEFRDFSVKGKGLEQAPCVTVGINIDEHSASYGEILEVYIYNKRTNSYKCCVLSSPLCRKNAKSHKMDTSKVGAGLRGKRFSSKVAS
jgi:hypothetical protein